MATKEYGSDPNAWGAPLNQAFAANIGVLETLLSIGTVREPAWATPVPAEKDIKLADEIAARQKKMRRGIISD